MTLATRPRRAAQLPADRAPRIAFTLIGGRNWTGGYNYLLNLLRVLSTEAPGQLQPLLLAGHDVPAEELKPFAAIPGCELVRDVAFDEASKPGSLARSLALGRDTAVQALLDRQRADVLFEAAAFYGWRLRQPAIAWIPDFQHRFLPQLFGRTAWWKRELGFRAQIAAGRRIMVSSEDSRAVCEGLHPATRGRVEAVRFAVRAPAPISDEQARAVARQYGLDGPYFFMPNQFWMHKNHRLVIDALARLRGQGQALRVLATGKQHDPRDPSHVQALKAAAAQAGLGEALLMPGLVPHEHLQPLMQASAALLNPSLFEGWSTTVEEARSAGVPMILSDLAVHHEQAGAAASYFDPHSADSLAQALVEFRPLPAEQRHSLREAARADAARRVARYAADFVGLVRRCTGPGGTP